MDDKCKLAENSIHRSCRDLQHVAASSWSIYVVAAGSSGRCVVGPRWRGGARHEFQTKLKGGDLIIKSQMHKWDVEDFFGLSIQSRNTLHSVRQWDHCWYNSLIKSCLTIKNMDFETGLKLLSQGTNDKNKVWNLGCPEMEIVSANLMYCGLWERVVFS